MYFLSLRKDDSSYFNVAAKTQTRLMGYNHIKKKILYYTDVKKSVINKEILPQWKDYK